MSSLFDSLNVASPHGSSEPGSSQRGRVYWHASPSPSLLRTQESPCAAAAPPLGTQAFLGELRKLPPSPSSHAESEASSPATHRRRTRDAGHTGTLRKATPDSQDLAVRKTRRSRAAARSTAPACTHILEQLNAVLEQSLAPTTAQQENRAVSVPSAPIPTKRRMAHARSADDVFTTSEVVLVKEKPSPTRKRALPPSPPRSNLVSAPPLPAKRSPTNVLSKRSPSKRSPPRSKSSPAKPPPGTVRSRVLAQRTNTTPDRIDLTQDEDAQVQFVSQKLPLSQAPQTQTVRQPGLPRTQRPAPLAKRSPSAPFRPPTRKPPMPASDDSFGLDDTDESLFDSLAQLGY